MSDYKKNEKKYLEKKYEIQIPDRITLDEYINLKRNLFISELIDKNISITNNQKKSNDIIMFKNKNIDYKYTYLRFDSNISYTNFCKDFYNIKSQYSEKTFFTNCGMSAILATLLSLDYVLCNYQIIFPDNDIYFETYDFYHKYIVKSNKENKLRKEKIIYIDSICKKFDFNKYKSFIETQKDVFAIIFDTTCFEAFEVSSFINYIVSKKLFCILIRSHTKLDMMASEISSMGSVNYLIPKEIKQDRFEVIKNIISQVYYILGKFGALCTPEKFPEFIFDKKFKKVNKNRVKQIENNNFNLYIELRNLDNGIVVLPTHKKFILFVLKNSINSEEQNKVIENKIRLFAEKNLNINYACSFGFDFVALDSYYDINEENFVIRISMNDDIENKNVIFKIKEFLNDNF